MRFWIAQKISCSTQSWRGGLPKFFFEKPEWDSSQRLWAGDHGDIGHLVLAWLCGIPVEEVPKYPNLIVIDPENKKIIEVIEPPTVKHTFAISRDWDCIEKVRKEMHENYSLMRWIKENKVPYQIEYRKTCYDRDGKRIQLEKDRVYLLYKHNGSNRWHMSSSWINVHRCPCCGILEGERSYAHNFCSDKCEKAATEFEFLKEKKAIRNLFGKWVFTKKAAKLIDRPRSRFRVEVYHYLANQRNGDAFTCQKCNAKITEDYCPEIICTDPALNEYAHGSDRAFYFHKGRILCPECFDNEKTNLDFLASLPYIECEICNRQLFTIKERRESYIVQGKHIAKAHGLEIKKGQKSRVKKVLGHSFIRSCSEECTRALAKTFTSCVHCGWLIPASSEADQICEECEKIDWDLPEPSREFTVKTFMKELKQ